MKKKNTLVFGIVVILVLFTQKTFAQYPGTGINTGTPREKLEVNGKVRIDSIPIGTPTDTFVLATDTTGVVHKFGITEFQYKFGIKDPVDPCDLDGKVMTEAFLTMIPTYIDDCNYLFGATAASGLRLISYDATIFEQTRSVLTDWSDALACYGRAKVGSNLLVNIKAASTSEQRIYLYPYGSLTNTAGIIIPFIGQNIPVSPTNITRMFYDGQYFLFSYQAGNGNNELTFSKYTFNGTNLVYVSDITFSPPASLSGLTFNSLVKGSNGFYYLQLTVNGSEASISKYSSTGGYFSQERRLFTNGLNTLNMISIGANIYIYYNNTTASTVKKMVLF